MSTLGKYYQDLLSWEQLYHEPVGQQPSRLRDSLRGQQQHRELVAQWPQTLRESIESAFVNAVSNSGLKDSVCSLNPGSSNQSIGNQVEDYTIQRLNTKISEFSISRCSGPGYPDQTLTQIATGTRMPLEVKATSNWDERDTNRRVLTSSSKKLRAQFDGPIYHLLLTILYSENEDSATINAIRLDFLEPTTPVNVRLEASVNHKILAEGHHYSKII